MIRPCAAFTLSLVLASCAAGDDNKSSAPVATPTTGEGRDTTPTDQPEATMPESAPKKLAATPSIASVQLKQDCPDPPVRATSGAGSSPGFAPSMPKPAAAKSEAKRKRKSDSMGPLQQPCSQSTLQLAFAGQAGEASVATIKDVRLLSANGKALGSLATRMPSIWNETSGAYEAWDNRLTPGSDHKTSYKLSVPNWAEVEKALGTSSFGQMYTMEVDVEIDGRATTLTSPQFERGRPQIIKT